MVSRSQPPGSPRDESSCLPSMPKQADLGTRVLHDSRWLPTPTARPPRTTPPRDVRSLEPMPPTGSLLPGEVSFLRFPSFPSIFCWFFVSNVHHRQYSIGDLQRQGCCKGPWRRQSWRTAGPRCDALRSWKHSSREEREGWMNCSLGRLGVCEGRWGCKCGLECWSGRSWARQQRAPIVYRGQRASGRCFKH